MAAVREVSEWFWNADFWLPPNSTYDSLEKAKVLTWGKAGELYLSLPLAILLIILRFIFERFIAAPFLNYLGLQDKPSSFLPNTFCEKVFQTISKFPNEERVEGLSKQLCWSKDDVRRWFKSRRQQSKPSLMKKATESSWRFAFYLAVSLYGFFVVFKEPWLWDLKLCFEGHGSHVSGKIKDEGLAFRAIPRPLTDKIYLYYLVEVGFYLSLKISLFVDVKRKFTGDIRSDEESGPEDEKVEMDNRDGILQDGKKKQ
ncbi:Ceramide synthase 6 [Acropora cervicornis]|uniref:Ceramide synthase 6 n=1 Tax=Acropora cervicornis TaxID=6130 RepID=A0AAD9V4U0_ACRCE|nr:Ceramide synthase 6 [Acropora cervicornis]